MWKNKGDIQSAEGAFRRAARLCAAANPDAYYIECIRHLAHMSYLQGHYENAYRTIKAVEPVYLSRNCDALFNLARYAARTGHTQEVILTLGQCLDLRPALYNKLEEEPDFK